MKTISTQLKSHIAGEVTTICTCWKVTLTNNTVFGFTDHVDNLIIDGVTYSASTGYTPSAIASTNNLAVDNLEVQGLLDSSAITEADLIAGLWDFAVVEIFAVNYADLTQGTLHLRKGTLGNVTTNRTTFVAELRGMFQAYTNNIGEVTTPTCRAQFCDTRCKLNVATYTVTGSITSLIDSRHFIDTSRTEVADVFSYGLLTMTSGLNAGYSMEIKSYTVGTKEIEIVLALPYALTVGDTYSMVKGCNKTITACIGYSNALNFRGEPHIPGIDKVLEYGTR